jgi:histidinol-phosphate aminotransferase
MSPKTRASVLQHLIRPEIISLPTYNAGMPEAFVMEKYGVSSVTRLASNENPHGVSQKALAAAASVLSSSWKYSDPSASALRKALSRHTHCPMERIVVGNGSEEIIALTCRVFLNPGDGVVTINPSFLLHEIYAIEQGAKVTAVNLTPEMQFDEEALIANLRKGCRMMVFSNPSNPVGTMLAKGGLSRIIESARADTIMVIDEAYYEYAVDSAGYPDSRSLLEASGKPYIILRTFSKAYGLAGLRVGYALCSDVWIVQLLNKLRTPFSSNIVAQSAAIGAIEDGAFLAKTIGHNQNERQRVRQVLAENGYAVADSAANFVFFDCGCESASVAEKLLAQGVIVKPWTAPGFENWMRVTIGSQRDNNRFLALLRKMK